MKRNNMWSRSEDRVRIRRRPGRSAGRNRQSSRNEDPWGRAVHSSNRSSNIPPIRNGPYRRYSYDDHPRRYEGSSGGRPDDWPTMDRSYEVFPRGYGRGFWERYRRDTYSRSTGSRDREWSERQPPSYEDGQPHWDGLDRGGHYGGGFYGYSGYGDFPISEHRLASTQNSPRHLDEPPGLRKIESLEDGGICWHFRSEYGCRRSNCKLKHELPEETPEEKSKRDSEMLQYFQKIDQVKQTQTKVQAPIVPPLEINLQQSTILDEPMDVINKEPVIKEPVIKEPVNNQPLVRKSSPTSKTYSQPPIPPKFRAGKEGSLRVNTTTPTSKAPKIIRAPANVVTIAAPKDSLNLSHGEVSKPPSRPPGVALDKGKRLSSKSLKGKPIVRGKCCLLCRRRFKSVEMLGKHIEESALHRQNLKKRADEERLSFAERKAVDTNDESEGSIFRVYA